MALVVLCGIVAGCGGDGGTSTNASQPSSADARLGALPFRLVKDQVAIGPRPAGSVGADRTVALIRASLADSGLKARVQEPLRNVVATIPGTDPGTIIVGAHYDTLNMAGFVGANDGASGVAVLLALAHEIKGPVDGPSITLAFFDAEEAPPGEAFESAGSAGSNQFVALARKGAQDTPKLDSIKAMYVLDMIGDCSLQIPREANSDEGLYGELEGAAFGGTADPVLDDHTPFLAAGIRAVDLIDFTFGPGGTPGAYWHTTEDTVDKVCPASLGQVLRAMRSILPA